MRPKSPIQGDNYVPPSFPIEWDTKLVAEGFPWEDFSGFSRLEGSERKNPSRRNDVPLKDRLDHAQVRVRAIEESNPEHLASMKLDFNQLTALVEANKEKCQFFEYLSYRFVEGLTLEEIAAQENVPLTTVQYRIDSVLKFIRSELFKTK